VCACRHKGFRAILWFAADLLVIRLRTAKDGQSAVSIR
jgi:hypothetical protein